MVALVWTSRKAAKQESQVMVFYQPGGTDSSIPSNVKSRESCRKH